MKVNVVSEDDYNDDSDFSDEKIRDNESDEESKEDFDEDRVNLALKDDLQEDDDDIEENGEFDLDVSQIDAYWIQTQLNKNFNDPLVGILIFFSYNQLIF